MLLLSRKTTGGIPSGHLRAVASTLQPLDPLRRATVLPAIDVLIPFTAKDIDTVSLCLQGILDTVRNPIGKIRLVTPTNTTHDNRGVDESQRTRIWEELTERERIVFESDDEALGSDLLGEMRARGLGNLDGWHLQQLIKLSVARTTTSPATLVVDADTVLLEPRTWLHSDGTQLLQFSEAYQPGYKRHFREFFEEPLVAPFSFVTHHQLMRSAILREMFPSPSSIIDWYETARKISGPSLSEYEAYGSYLWAKYPKQVRLGTWSNLWSPKRDNLLDYLRSTSKTIREAVPDYCSVSFHAHSQQESKVKMRKL